MTTASKGRNSKSLLADDSGATMVMGVFMAMMVVGMIYYVWGLGGTIISRERLQDGADAAAFGASVFQARGMNLMAMLNVLMSVFAIIGTACRLLDDFMFATMIADDAACALCLATVVCIPASETFCEPAVEHDIEYADEHSMLREIADDVCDNVVAGIYLVQTIGIRPGALLAGEAYVLTAIPRLYAPTVDHAFFLPGSLFDQLQAGTIPGIQSEDDDTNWACHHGATGMFVRGPALALVLVGEFALFEPPSVGFIAGEIDVAAEEFSGSDDSSEHYCNHASDHRAFQRVPTDHWLGDGNFQNYAIVWAPRRAYEWATRGVQAANWGREDNQQILGGIGDRAAELHVLSFSTSEYYFEEAEGDCGSSFPDSAAECAHQEWLWHTRWRARLRRFHLGAGNNNQILRAAIQGVEGVIVH